MSFDIIETTIEQIHAAYKSGVLTCRELVQMYLDRIEALRQKWPGDQCDHLAQSRRLERSRPSGWRVQEIRVCRSAARHSDYYERSGRCHADADNLGSLLFKDYFPERDAFVVDKLKKAGAIILAKATLGELGGGDTHGSLFGSTKNPYDLARTAGGSSGGSGASVSANFCTVAVGQEGFASIRRPSTWNGIAGMRPTAGLVSRSGVFAGWPSVTVRSARWRARSPISPNCST